MFNLKPLLASAIVAATMAVAGGASAATVVSGTVCEGGIAPAIAASACDQILGDFGSNPAKRVLTPGGAFGLYGGVANGVKADQWTDAWTIDFGADAYSLVFNWAAKTAGGNFDGILFVNGAQYVFDTAVNAMGASISLGTLTGVVVFDVNPILGNFKPQERGTWDLQVTPVPLPAGLPLLALGLAAFGLARAHQKA
jgi:hypothetical protein